MHSTSFGSVSFIHVFCTPFGSVTSAYLRFPALGSPGYFRSESCPVGEPVAASRVNYFMVCTHKLTLHEHEAGQAASSLYQIFNITRP